MSSRMFESSGMVFRDYTFAVPYRSGKEVAGVLRFTFIIRTIGEGLWYICFSRPA